MNALKPQKGRMGGKDYSWVHHDEGIKRGIMERIDNGLNEWAVRNLFPNNIIVGREEIEELNMTTTFKYGHTRQPDGLIEFSGLKIMVCPIKNHLSFSFNEGN